MTADDWLHATRTSYDTVASSYAEQLRDLMAQAPYDRALFQLFADLVTTSGGGRVADVGCGPGRVTAHLVTLGLDAFGIDLSPAMVETARRDHPGVRFEVGSMTDLALADGSLGGVLAWYSLIHVPDDVVPGVLARFRRALRPGGVALVAFHVGDEHYVKTEGYGGHPMSVPVFRRPPERVATWLDDAGLPVEARLVREPTPPAISPQGYLLACRPAGSGESSPDPIGGCRPTRP